MDLSIDVYMYIMYSAHMQLLLHSIALKEEHVPLLSLILAAIVSRPCTLISLATCSAIAQSQDFNLLQVIDIVAN